MPQPIPWRERVWILPLPAARQAQTLLAALPVGGVTVASRTDAGADLTLWTQGRDHRLLAAAVRGLGPPVADRRHDEAALLAAHAPAGPAELAPGVWVDPAGRSRLPRGAVRLVVPPAPAFGDGRHPSTRLAARALLQLDVRGRRVLDLGCGTGVLGLLARKRGAARVDFADIDPGAVRACRDACRRNGLVRPRVWQADLLQGVVGTGYDVVLGNLYADLCLRLLADARLQQVLPAGTLVLSGVASKRRKTVEKALRQAGFTVDAVAEEAWWCSLLAKRRPVR